MAMATSQSGWPKHTICDRWMFLVPPHLAPMLMGNIPMTAIIATKTIAVVSAVGWPLLHLRSIRTRRCHNTRQDGTRQAISPRPNTTAQPYKLPATPLITQGILWST